MTAIQIIANSAKAVGIKVTPAFPEYATLVDDRGHARYDLLLGNDRQYSNTPWTYYQYIYQLPFKDNQTNTNYERYVSQKAWDMTKVLDKIPSTNTGAYKAQMARLQRYSCRICPRFRSGTTACGPCSTRSTGRTGRPDGAGSTRPRPGGTTGR